MSVPHAFAANDAATLKKAVNKPVLVAGRINQPQVAEEILAQNKADMIGVARALIADPEFVNKFSKGNAEDIRACIGCNQACVGHRLAHYAISCIQNPVSGRETQYPDSSTAASTQSTPLVRTVVVVGGGPAGMKAAIVAAQRGHRVHLFETTKQLGGQSLLAEKLPGRAEFGGVTTNLIHELKQTDVQLSLCKPGDKEALLTLDPDVVIIATGATPRLPDVEIEGIELVDSCQAIRDSSGFGQNVVIADWACDWSGLGLAQKLAQNGHHVRLLCGGSIAGESIQGIVRDQWIGELHALNVEVTTYARFYGAQNDTAFFQHMTSGQPIVCENVDTIVSCYAPRSNNHHAWLSDFAGEVHTIGDAISPRSVEEAILEGFRCA